ncbi:hypothetical protein [Bacillus nitratireducens]|uniref:hypothetical protein n=1 Tax=Bacillus nitratireducens TaxID=2026193 RepID=UPI003879BB21
MLYEIMTPREVSDRWRITPDTLRMRLKHSCCFYCGTKLHIILNPIHLCIVFLNYI